MSSLTDLDQGGTNRQTEKVYLGPTVGWIPLSYETLYPITAAGTYSPSFGVTLITVNIAASPTINLWNILQPSVPAGVIGANYTQTPLVIVDIGGNAGTHPISVVPYGSYKISGAASLSLDVAYQAILLLPDVGTGDWINITPTATGIWVPSAADKTLYSTGVGATAETSLTSAGRALIDDADASAQRTTLGLGSIATKAQTSGSGVQKGDGAGGLAAATAGTDYVDKDTTSNLTAGYTATSASVGTITGSNQTTTPAPASGNFQHLTLNGSSLTGTWTFAAPSSVCSMVVQVVNGGSGSVGATLATSGYTKVTGEAWATTNGNKYLFFITKSNNYSHLHIQALQ